MSRKTRDAPTAWMKETSGLPAEWLYFDAKRLTDPRITAETMRVIVNLLGTEIRLKQEISLDPPSPVLKDALRALKNQLGAPLERFLKEDFSPAEGCTILVNGRNIGSLGQMETEIRDGDEITFTVLVAGG